MARKWETIICYEDRCDGFRTSRWRLSGVNTRQGFENTDGGVLWLEMTRAGDTVTVSLYKSASRGASDEVATGSANVSGLDGTAAAAAEVDLAEANASGLTGSLRLHQVHADAACPVQVGFCVDEDLHALWDGIESLPGYDATRGCAEFIRLAGEDLLAKVAAMFRDRLGGNGTAEAWFLEDPTRSVPDLRRIANPAQLRAACAHRALALAIGRSHKMGADTMYSRLRDYHQSEHERALASLVLAVRPADGSAEATGLAAAVRQSRV